MYVSYLSLFLGGVAVATPHMPMNDPRQGMRGEVVDRVVLNNPITTTEVNNSVEIIPEEVTNLFTTKALLGEALFSDTSLSFSRSQSCASCHNPDQAFIDTRDNGVLGAVSLGDDNSTLGNRNTPMLTYALFSPAFSQDADGFIGGQFFDGRASDLTEQAKGPFLNPVEMQMPDVASVIERVIENPNYITAFQRLYGNNIFADNDVAFEALADAIANFERSDSFATFDSKLDRVNNRTERLTAQEAQGQQLFRSSRCVTCHSDRGNNALFTDFRYENIGVPKNTTVLDIIGDNIDHGLLENPAVTNAREDGKFKIPSLRNVAVTAPYMHNGKFQTLEAVVHFYNTRDVAGAINPETGVEWEASEIRANRVGGNRVGNLGLNDAQEAAIVAFLKTLTDERYEHLNP